ncbi:TonB-dependent hemoglobin/transferrin/lactoferrin family receptor [Gallaecimonas mangrovi]|uniref:TonB-dependent hemoglobin/transferrin/lactoferrin family receptor n=1 Tax=Gallaecimonas mangrovi TaxID=2291597 RepID=UPI001866D0D3|nr:TonB-dependent hemoglobin/transferrin/lactoferrin family receptor [Gallaecimonas mangrovi]
MKVPPRFALFALSLAVSQALATEQASNQAPQTSDGLEHILVQGQKAQLAKPDTAVTTINAQQISRTLSTDLSDVLRYEPGVTVTPNSRGGGGIGTINIRGLDGDRVKVLVDGVEMADTYTPTSSTYLNAGRNTLDVDALSQMQIVKGGDVSAGSGALGGVVAFKTKDPADFLDSNGNDSYLGLEGGYRSDSEQYTESGTLANRTGAVESLLIYTHRDGQETENHGGGSDISGSSRGAVDPGDTQSDNVLGKLIWYANSQNAFGVTAEHYEYQSDFDLYSESSSDEPEIQQDDVTRNHLGLYQVSTSATAFYDQLQWQVDYQKTRTKSYTLNPSSSNQYNRLYAQKGWQGKVDLSKQLGNHLLSYGLNYRYQKYQNLVHETASGTTTTSRFSPNATGDNYGLYLSDSWQLTDSFTLLPALRYDNYRYNADADQYVTTDWGTNKSNKLTAQLGMNWALTDVYSLYARYGSGFRAPSFENLYYYYEHSGSFGSYSYGYLIKPNPNLKPEESTFAELGLRMAGRYGYAQLAVYDNKYRNFIQQQYSLGASTEYPTGEFTTVNLNGVEIKGVELSGELELASVLSSQLTRGIVLSASAAYADGSYSSYEDASGNVTKNMPLDSISPMTIVAGVQYDAPGSDWGSSLHATWTAAKRQSDITSSSQWLATPSFTVLDTTAYYKPMANLKLSVGVFNLLDKKYWLWNQIRTLSDSSTNLDRYSQPGRNVRVNFKLSF